jgi:hypothetical protein
LRIAYVTLKANACSEKKDNGLSLEMNIFDKKCNINDKDCLLSDLNDDSNIYDF